MTTKHVRRFFEVGEEYPSLYKAGEVLSAPPAKIVGRDANELRKGLRNPEKANIALLGEPGTGKAIIDSEWLPVADERGYIRMGDVKVGDRVFDENGNPTNVIGVYPQGKKGSYRVNFADGSSTICNDEHLWDVRTAKQHYDDRPYQTKTLREILDLGITRMATRDNGTRQVEEVKWYIPKAKAITRNEREYGIHPYVIGALIGDGSLTIRPLVLSSDDEYVVSKVAHLLGASGYEKKSKNFNWEFLRSKDAPTRTPTGEKLKFIQPYEIAELEDISDIMVKSHNKRIPAQYLLGSIEQRWQLLQGLMDTDGSVLDNPRLRCSYHTSSEGLAEDVQTLVTSLGMSAMITTTTRDGYRPEYNVHLSIPEEMKQDCFTLPRRLETIERHQDTPRRYNKHYGDVAITSVEDLGREDYMTCIRVEVESHLFQVSKSHIVTHNTAAVQAFAYDEDSVDHYLTLEVNPEKIMGQGDDRDTALLIGFRNIVEEAGKYSREQNVIVVLFIDEFHKIAMFSPSLVEALKPILEKSALNNFRIIASTTFEEYNEWIASKNRALDQRFLRITLSELPEEVVLKILRGRAVQHNVEELLHPEILHEIYRESKRILLSNSQPRASLDILLSMIGETVKTERMENGELVREFYTPQELDIASDYSISRPLLKRIIQRTHSIDIDNKVNVHHVSNELKTRLFNQDQAIDTVMRYLEMAAIGFSDPERPNFSFLATGTTGTGKTELAKIVSESMRLPLRRFDMSRYASEEDAGAFADDLFHAAWSTPNAYLLIDEVEKSSRKAMNILLQVLDDARLTDSKNPDRVASFTGSIINLTTNLGSEVLHSMHKHKDDDAEVDTELIYKALADSDIFETAVLGRIDAIVPFRPLPFSALEKIAIGTLQNFIDIAETRKRKIMISKDVIPYIVTDRTSMDTERGGARDVKRNIKNLVAQVLANHITHAKEEVPVIIYIKGEPRFKFAHIVDPHNAEVDLQPCYTVEKTNQLLETLSKRMNLPLINDGLLLADNVSLKVHAQDIFRIVKQGYNRFKTEVDGEKFTIVGVE